MTPVLCMVALRPVRVMAGVVMAIPVLHQVQ